MWENQVSIDIAAPPEKVYRYLADFARHGEWSMSVTELENTTPGPVRVGTVYKSHETIPIEFDSYAEIKTLDEPTRIAWESTDHKVFRTNWELVFTPVPEGTHMDMRVTFHAISALGHDFLPQRAAVVEPENLQSLHRLKTILEA